MSVYPYGKRKGAWYRGTPFLIAFIVVVVGFYIFISFSDPVNADHTNTFLVVLRHIEFFVVTIIEILFAILLLIAAVVYFLQLIGKKQISWHSPNSSYSRRKSRKISLDADRLRHSGIKGIIVGIFVSLIIFALGIFMLYWMVIPKIKDIPDALTGNTVTLNAKVTESYWTSGRYPTWDFKFAGQSFSTARPTLHAGEDAIVTFLPHSHYIIEYKHEKLE